MPWLQANEKRFNSTRSVLECGDLAPLFCRARIASESGARSPHSKFGHHPTALRDIINDTQDVRQGQPINTRDSAPEPDLAVVPARADDYFHAHPITAELVIEVAESSKRIDYQKRSIYAAANVSEYWIVFPERCRVEVYTGPMGDRYTDCREYIPPETVVSEMLPVFRLDLATFFPR